MEPYPALKPREVEILRLMADGRSNREIAQRLFIGVETVRWYAKQIFGKLDVPGRAEAADKARSLGLLGTDPIGDLAPTEARLPTQHTPFVGRERQLAEITRLMSETRLLSLTGPGGIGKTRLALMAASQAADRFADGVHFTDLAPVGNSASVAAAIARSLNIGEGGDGPIIETIKRAVGRRSLLLLLDNFEHVIAAAPLVSDLLAGAPNIRIIVTSRESLRVSGERVYQVPPMDVAASHPSASSEAVSLFLQRSQAARPTFHLHEGDANTVAEICRRLDGMPLAIELAAALSRFLTPDAILARIEHRFQSLTSGPRDAPQRQQTLRKAIDWSFDLLGEDEKLLLAKLAIFRGACSLEAIEAVCRGDRPADVYDALAGLVDKSMIREEDDPNREPRFVMLDTIQEYAWERLEETGTTWAMRHGHARHFADVAARAQAHLRQANQEYWFQRLTIEHDDIRAALEWSLSGGETGIGLRLVGALRDFWFYEGHHLEGQHWTRQALNHLADVEPALQCDVLMTAGMLASARQENQQSVAYFVRAIGLARQQEDPHATGWATLLLAQSTCDASTPAHPEHDVAAALCQDGLAILQGLREPAGLCQGLNILGNIYAAQGSQELAKSAYEACLRLCGETGERRREMIVLANLSRTATDLGNVDEARHLALQSLRLSWQMKFVYMCALELGQIAPENLVPLGRIEQAARLLGASAALQEAMNIRQQPSNQPYAARTEATVRRQLSATAFQSAYEAGRMMSLEAAVMLALSELEG